MSAEPAPGSGPMPMPGPASPAVPALPRAGSVAPAPAATIARAALVAQLGQDRLWDLIVIGGGATGLGVALDAATRGFAVLLLEAGDFAQGTSSRATKLVHGGVRYLAQGNVALVREALHERATLLANAPHLAQALPFVLPTQRWWQPWFYGAGLKAYDALAGARSLGATQVLSAQDTLARLPGARAQGLHGGVQYWDAQFDDARLALALARTALAQGALVLNHCPVQALLRQQGRVCGVQAQERESGARYTLRARCVVNATGVWVDQVRDLDREAEATAVPPMVSPSQGAHLVVERDFLPGAHALIVPRTADGRVLFAVPWLGKTLLGTTDTARADLPREPQAFESEIDFILHEAGRHLARAPARQDLRSIWAGLRPLVKPGTALRSSAISREHTVCISPSGLLTVTGGKWTTYRAMAQDVLAHCFAHGLLPARGARDVTTALRLAGAPAQAPEPSVPLTQAPGLHLYGSDAPLLQELPGAARWLWRDGDGGLSEAMVRFAVRYEMARRLDDVLARRSRLLFLDAAQALRLARPVAALLEEELGRPLPAQEITEFETLARQYGSAGLGARA